MRLPVVLFLAAFAGLCAAFTVLAQDAGQNPEELFKQLDKSKDGRLTAEEVGTEQARFFERALRVGDTDKDGVLTKDEFVNAMKQHQPAAALPALDAGAPAQKKARDPKLVFQKMDKNGDGKLTRDEIPKQAAPRLAKLFDKLGKDELTQEEFLGAADAAGKGAAAKKGKGKANVNKGNDAAAKLVAQGDKPASAAKAEETPKADAPPKKGDAPPPGDDRKKGRRRRGPDGGPEGFRPPGAAPFMRLLDANNDHKLSKDELSKAAEKFDELDKNKDGQLDPPELFGPPPDMRAMRPGSRFGRRGNRPDGPPKGSPDGAPGEGRISQRLFERLDKNGDGKLAKDETPERFQEQFKKLDANGDGTVDAAEFNKAMQQRSPKGKPGPDGEKKGNDNPKSEGPDSKPADAPKADKKV